MFRELYAVARHTPLTLIVTPHKTDAGDELRVIVIPKPGDDAPEESALHKPLSFVGTPEELDTFTAEALQHIEAYTTGVNALREKLDLPTEAIAAEAAKEGKTSTPRPASPAGKKPNKKAPAKSVKPAAKPAAKKPAAPAVKSPDQRSEAAPGSTATATGGPSPAQEGATPSGPAASTPTAQTSDHPAPSTAATTASTTAHKAPRHPDLPPRQPKIDRASREQCIEDGRAYLVAIGAAKPSRELFVRWALTGRRYEKLWDNFAAFLAEVRGETSNTDQRAPAAQELPAAAPPAKSDVSMSNAAQQPVQTGAHPTENQRTVLDPSAKWPFPRDKTDEQDDSAPVTELHTGGEQAPAYNAPTANPTGMVTQIVTDTGMVLASTARRLAVGDKYTHPEFGEYRVISHSLTDDRYVVMKWTDEIFATKPTNHGDLLEGLATTSGA